LSFSPEGGDSMALTVSIIRVMMNIARLLIKAVYNISIMDDFGKESY
jgi:hypothetical protein